MYLSKLREFVSEHTISIIIFLLGIWLNTYFVLTYFDTNDNFLGRSVKWYELTLMVFIFFLTYVMFLLIESYRNYDYVPKSKAMVTLKEYNKNKAETTKIQKDKLYASKRFIDTLNYKGSNEINWNWQLRDKYKGNDDNFSDSQLSNITVSEEEEN